MEILAGRHALPYQAMLQLFIAQLSVKPASLVHQLVQQTARILFLHLSATDEILQAPLDLLIHLMQESQRSSQGPLQTTQRFAPGLD